MKHVKRLAGFLLALTMVLCMGITAFADSNGSITINNTVKDTTYTIYRIFDLESYSAETGAYSYKVNNTWETFAKSEAAKTYISVDAQGYVTWKEGADAAAFAKLALAYAKENNIANNGAATASADNEEVKFGNLALGYYLVDTSLGALCGLTTTAPDATVNEKNDKPSVDKEVEEDSDSSWGDTDDADIGQTVNFHTTITAQAGAENYVLHDKMSEGLTFGSVTGITLNGKAVAGDSYSVVSTGLTDDCTFHVVFTEDFCDTLNAEDKIVVSYTAALNEKAVIAGSGNPNETRLQYGDNNYTEWDKTITYTWDVDIFKYADGGNDVRTPLAGAKFTLSKSSDGANPIRLISLGDNKYRVAKAGEESAVTEITTDATGKFTIEGLDADAYYLTETEAPDGYNRLAGPVTIVISTEKGTDSEGHETLVGSTKVAGKTVEEVDVLNQTGSELPSTGGIGTTIFYIIGSILMIGAAVLLVTRKRMSASSK